MGCVAYPVPNVALFISEIGMIAMENYSSTIGDSELKRLDYVNVYTDSKDNIGKIAEFIYDNLVEVELDNKEMSSYLWVRQGFSNGLLTQTLEFKKMKIDLEKNYNDDLPYEEIINLLSSQNKELILFNGKPGTGKTSLIKHLIGTISDKKFLYIDSSLLKNISSSAFISFLLEYRNSIVVLEDCEKILSKREEGNPFMGTLLNLTDGIIGETVNCKFICSFNCAESKIDEALLRKGRLSLKYTFNNLSLEKTQLLVPEAKRGMVLADIYHKDKENVINKQEVKKIGF
jgi:SpoVK/Ycf46/Vps4 family AAA+-type ATPase